MAVHTILGGASLAAAAAGGGLMASAQAVSHDTALLLIPAAISSVAGLVGAAVAVISYLRHRNDASALDLHEAHDDERFDELRDLIIKVLKPER